jgi:hypothetical protein
MKKLKMSSENAIPLGTYVGGGGVTESTGL